MTSPLGFGGFGCAAKQVSSYFDNSFLSLLMKSTTSVITEDGSPLQFRSWIEPKKAFNYFSEEPTVFRILWFMFLCMLGIGEGIWRLNSKTSLMMSLVFSGSNSLIYVPNFRCGLLMLVLPLPFLPVLSVFIFFFSYVCFCFWSVWLGSWDLPASASTGLRLYNFHTPPIITFLRYDRRLG